MLIIKKIVLDKNSYIEKIRYNNSSIYLLDSKAGCIYKIQGEINNSSFNLPNIIWIFIAILVIAIVMTIIYKVKNKRKNK